MPALLIDTSIDARVPLWNVWRIHGLRPSALSKALHGRLGVLLDEQYAPTGGAFVNRHFGLTIVDLHGTVDSPIWFEHMTRVWEAVHIIAFVGFLPSHSNAICRFSHAGALSMEAGRYPRW